MSRERPPLNTDDIIRRYSEGETVTSLSRYYRVRSPTISRILNTAGIKTSMRHDLPTADIASAYQAGISSNQLAIRYGVSRNVIDRRLTEHGVTLRSQSEAERIKWAQMTQAEREQQVASAHAAVRGKRKSLESLLKAAKTIEAKGQFDSELERELHSMLLDRGIETVPQLAIGPYNCDLGAPPVAVEVFGGHWHWTGRHLRRLGKRVDYLFDAGFHVLIIQQSDLHPITSLTADYVAAYVQAAQRNPSSVREYRVIRGAGETIAGARSDSDDRALVPTFTVTTNALGQYVSVPDNAHGM